MISCLQLYSFWTNSMRETMRQLTLELPKFLGLQKVYLQLLARLLKLFLSHRVLQIMNLVSGFLMTSSVDFWVLHRAMILRLINREIWRKQKTLILNTEEHEILNEDMPLSISFCERYLLQGHPALIIPIFVWHLPSSLIFCCLSVLLSKFKKLILLCNR